jgi:anti-anti-sigma factor
MASSSARSQTNRRGTETLVSHEAGRTVVALEGEHDVATVFAVTQALVAALEADDSDVVVDLSGVTFMDASTIGVLLAARNDLRDQSRGFALRSPSKAAARVLEICGLTGQLEVVGVAPPGALSSWVSVPKTDPERAAASDAAASDADAASPQTAAATRAP